ncbi:MAG: hypothetical protein HYS45_00475 [Parcubacteria group bacterium]|nr:hypothetical protein [Parcubacteria group bacterium]
MRATTRGSPVLVTGVRKPHTCVTNEGGITFFDGATGVDQQDSPRGR